MKHGFFCGIIIVLCFSLFACSAVSSTAPNGAAEPSPIPLTEEQKQKIEDALGSLPDTAADTWVNEETPFNGNSLDILDVLLSETKEEAVQKMIGILNDAPYPYDIIKRDSVYIQGKEVPCIWLFCRNGLGETLDFLFYDSKNAADLEYTRNDPIFIYTRKNECTSYVHLWHYPKEYTGIGETTYFTSLNGKFQILYTGQAFSLMDVRADTEIIETDDGEKRFSTPINYWNGSEWKTDVDRPDISSPFEPDQANYPTYMPEVNLKRELESMLVALETSGEGYNWELQNDEITLEGKPYPVVWVFAENMKGEWLDILLSEDPDFCYLMTRHPEEVGLQRKTQTGTLNRTNEDWLTQDVFYYGYSFYMDGDAHAIRDCGMAWGMK